MSRIARSTTDLLRQAPPQLHGPTAYFGLAWPAMEWLEQHVAAEMTTLETGCGGSSILFAAAGARHTVISPVGDEHDRVREWCAEHDISTDRLTFVAEPSDEALVRSWKPEPLDVVLIDGAHGFPYPALDWFFTAPHVRVGGHVVVDDAFLPSVHSLVRYLRSGDAWVHVASPGYRTVVFRKASDAISYDWVGSRYDRLPHFDYLPAGRRLFAYARHFLIDRSAVGQRLVARLRRG